VDNFVNNQRTIKEIWLASFRLYRKVLPRVWSIAALVGVLAIVMAFLSDKQCQFKANEITTANVICVSAHVTTLLLMIYLGALIFYKTHVISEGQNVTLRGSLLFVLKKYFKITVALMIVLFAGAIGVIAFVLPGVFLSVLFIMVQPLILFDNHGVFSALKGSCKLVWGNWWRTFVVVYPVIFLNFLTGLGIQFSLTRGYWYVIMGGMMLVLTFFYPLLYVFILTQFNDLKLRHHARESL